MDKNTQEKLIKAFIGENLGGLFSSDNVRKTMAHLIQLGIWEESKDILKQYILDYWGFFENAEFCNGEVRRKRD